MTDNKKEVGFVVEERKLSVWEEVRLKYNAARQKMDDEATKARNNSKKSQPRDENPFSFQLERYRTLDSVKALPRGSKSPSRHASGARTAESVSRATTSLTVRSAVQIRTDRAFKEGFEQAELPKPHEEKRLDLQPLDPEGGKRGIGRDVTRGWRSRLREINSTTSNKGDPVANNSLSRNAMSAGQPPGMFAQMPERLGQWRDDMGRIDLTSGAEASSGPVGQWVPASVLRRKAREERRKEAAAKAEAVRREQDRLEFESRARVLREREEAQQRETAAIEARERQKAEEEEERRRARAAKKVDLQRKKAMAAPSCLQRASTSSSAGPRGRYISHEGGAGGD